EFLEGLSTIQGLVPDPYFDGGGFHEIGPGGKLGIHADFRINNKLHLSRRMNVIIYLNEDWREEYNGSLELWSRDMKEKVRGVELDSGDTASFARARCAARLRGNTHGGESRWLALALCRRR